MGRNADFTYTLFLANFLSIKTKDKVYKGSRRFCFASCVHSHVELGVFVHKSVRP